MSNGETMGGMPPEAEEEMQRMENRKDKGKDKESNPETILLKEANKIYLERKQILKEYNEAFSRVYIREQKLVQLIAEKGDGAMAIRQSLFNEKVSIKKDFAERIGNISRKYSEIAEKFINEQKIPLISKRDFSEEDKYFVLQYINRKIGGDDQAFFVYGNIPPEVDLGKVLVDRKLSETSLTYEPTLMTDKGEIPNLIFAPQSKPELILDQLIENQQEKGV